MSLHCQRNIQKRIKIYDLLMALFNAAVLSQRHFPELPSRGQTVLVTWSCRITAPDSAALLLQHCQAFKAAAQCLSRSKKSSRKQQIITMITANTWIWVKYLQEDLDIPPSSILVMLPPRCSNTQLLLLAVRSAGSIFMATPLPISHMAKQSMSPL